MAIMIIVITTSILKIIIISLSLCLSLSLSFPLLASCCNYPQLSALSLRSPLFIFFSALPLLPLLLTLFLPSSLLPLPPHPPSPPPCSPSPKLPFIMFLCSRLLFQNLCTHLAHLFLHTPSSQSSSLLLRRCYCKQELGCVLLPTNYLDSEPTGLFMQNPVSVF